MTPTDQCWIMCQASVIQTINLITTSHLVQGVIQANSNPHLVNYTKQGWRSPGEPVRLLSLCSWSMTVFQHTNYSETVVQLCGGLALSHTISTTIDCQRDTEQAREGDSHALQESEMQNETEKTESHSLPKPFPCSLLA